MKKTIALIICAFTLFSCKIPTATNAKLDNKSELAIKGNWTIASVTFPGSEYFTATSFDLADSKCLVNSSWKFVSNNNKGVMSLNSGACTAFTSPITWFINKDGEFVLKILDNQKAKKVTSGYVLKITNQTNSSFQLIDKMDIAGKIVDVIYTFNRI